MPRMRVGPVLVCKLEGWKVCGEVLSTAPKTKSCELAPNSTARGFHVSVWRFDLHWQSAACPGCSALRPVLRLSSRRHIILYPFGSQTEDGGNMPNFVDKFALCVALPW
jgi:hypothetical protein